MEEAVKKGDKKMKALNIPKPALSSAFLSALGDYKYRGERWKRRQTILDARLRLLVNLNNKLS